MDNEQIAKSLKQLADLMEFQGVNPFRLKAYRNGARSILELPQTITSMIEAGDDLTKLDGIGKSVAQKCKELCETGKLQQLEDLFKEVPKSVLEFLNIPKLGPKKAAVLFNDLNLTTLDQLKAACEAGKVAELPGFGAKSQQAILEGITIAAAAARRLLWKDADKLVKRLREHFSSCDAIEKIEFAGSYRRGKETVGDLDLLVTSSDVDAVMDHFASFPDVQTTIVRGGTKMSVRTDEEFQMDLRVVPEESFGAALQYFTGSKEHNVVLRGMAKQAGLRVNEWGVYQIEGEEQRRIAGESEENVYDAIGLPVFAPESREGRFEFGWAESDDFPEMVREQDIQGDLHMHTVATDGSATIAEMAAAAIQRGLKFIAITDHSKRVAMAGGLDSDRLLDQWKEIDDFNMTLDSDFVVLKGIECDILESGGMDLPDEVLAQADWVIGSLHFGQSQPRQQITDRIVGAIENEHVDMIAHPTGRILNRRPPYDVDLNAVFDAAAAHQTFLELNAAPKRLDLNDVHLIAAKARGIPIVINTDSHKPGSLKNIEYGIIQARRAALTANDVANTWTWKKMQDWRGI